MVLANGINFLRSFIQIF